MNSKANTVKTTPSFLRQAAKLTKKNAGLKKRIEKTLDQLKIDPYHPGLRTHKADTAYGMAESSRVTGDLRLIWTFLMDEKMVILAIALDDHGVYK